MCSKVFTSYLRDISFVNNGNFNSDELSYKLAFILFLSFRVNQKQESTFQEVCGQITKTISVFWFIANRALIQSYAELNTLLQRCFHTCYSCLFIVSLFYMNMTKKAYFTQTQKCGKHTYRIETKTLSKNLQIFKLQAPLNYVQAV